MNKIVAKIMQNLKSYYFTDVKNFIALLSVFVSFNLSAQPVPATIRPLQDYHFFSDEPLSNGVNYKVLSSRKEMDRLFGKTTRPDTPDFAKELMLVMVVPSTKRDMKLSFEKMSIRAGEFVEVYCNVNLKGHLLTYEHNPIAVAIIPRAKNTNEVHFYNDKTGAFVKRIPIKD